MAGVEVVDEEPFEVDELLEPEEPEEPLLSEDVVDFAESELLLAELAESVDLPLPRESVR